MCCLYYYILPPRRRSHPWATPERRGVITLLIADFRSSPRYAASYRPPSLCFSNRPPHDYERVFFPFFLREGAFASSIFLSEPVNGVVFRKRRLLFVVVPPLPSIFLSASGNNNHTYRRGKVFHSLFFLLLLLLQNCLGDAHLAAVAISPSALFLSFFNCPLPGASFSTTV